MQLAYVAPQNAHLNFNPVSLFTLGLGRIFPPWSQSPWERERGRTEAGCRGAGVSVTLAGVRKFPQFLGVVLGILECGVVSGVSQPNMVLCCIGKFPLQIGLDTGEACAVTKYGDGVRVGERCGDGSLAGVRVKFVRSIFVESRICSPLSMFGLASPSSSSLSNC